MVPIHELLNRIRWDAEFGRGQFELGYFDRLEDRIIRVPFQEVEFSGDASRAFRVIDLEGKEHFVPLHRVREVFRDGQLIWRRPGPDRTESAQAINS